MKKLKQLYVRKNNKFHKIIIALAFKNIEWSNRTNSIYEESKYDTNIVR